LKKSIGILGCGWLGLPLGKRLVEIGYTVRGTVRKEEKLPELQSSGITAFHINLLSDRLYGDVQGFLEKLDVLIINVPPGTRKNPDYDFAASIQLFMTFVEVYKIPNVFFVSSTSVFEDAIDIPTYDESDEPNATSNTANQLIRAEKWVQEKSIYSTIIRPGGLMGGDRHPVHFLAGREDIKNPYAPVNMVRRNYLIDLFERLISQDQPREVVHAISEKQVSRKQFYEEAAQDFGLEAPHFKADQESIGKIICSKQIDFV
jgi:nucleoside-diphosphate-sugar epimerase